MPESVKNCEEDVAACVCLIWKKRPLKMRSYMTCVYTSYYHYYYYYYYYKPVDYITKYNMNRHTYVIIII